MTQENGHRPTDTPEVDAAGEDPTGSAAHAGDERDFEQFVSLAYRELHALAQARLRRSARNALLDTTGLLHECYLRLKGVGNLQASNRRRLMAYASRVMRSIIVDAVRQNAAQRRGGDLDQVALDTELPDPNEARDEQVLRVSEALDALRLVDERLVTIVELRYYAGLGNDEIADILQISERTVRREWNKARALLYQEIHA